MLRVMRETFWDEDHVSLAFSRRNPGNFGLERTFMGQRRISIFSQVKL
jgi:hypothetical protein